MKRHVIYLTKQEIQSGLTRQDSAEQLILQLPKNHDGRNTWLLNYGVRDAALTLRKKRDLKWLRYANAAESRNAQLERQHRSDDASSPPSGSWNSGDLIASMHRSR